MVGIVVVTRAALLIARRASTWTVAEHLNGRSPVCVAVDTRDPTRVYCGTAGAGLFRSRDSGRSWEPVGPGIDHPKVTAVAVGSAEQADGFGIWPRSAEAYVYRKTGLKGWEQAMSGLPEARGTTASRFATHAGEPGVIYAANNRGLFISNDAGRSWKALDLLWPEPGLADGVNALACLPE
jgi:hypothetical protein